MGLSFSAPARMWGCLIGFEMILPCVFHRGLGLLTLALSGQRRPSHGFAFSCMVGAESFAYIELRYLTETATHNKMAFKFRKSEKDL